MKRLRSLSRMFACDECVSKWLFIANFDRRLALKLLEKEADRQLEVAVDAKNPIQRQCMRGCGKYVMAVPEASKLGYRIPLFCSDCNAEWARLNGGTEERTLH